MALPPSITDNTVTLTFGAAHTYYGYCTIADVGYEFPDQALFTSLTNSAIAQEITYAAGEIQDQLARVYQMPYVGTDGGVLLTLRNVNAKLAAANLIQRYFSTGEPNLSPAGAERRGYAEAILTDVIDGRIQWASPFADAVAMGEKPEYPLSAGATVLPDPNSQDPWAANPVFTMGAMRYRRGSIV